MHIQTYTHTHYTHAHTNMHTLQHTGELDDLPEIAFYMVGDIEEVVAKAARLAEEQQQ